MTITTLLPNSDSYKQGITFSTGGTIFSLVNDASDATYISAAVGNQYPNVYFHLGAPDTVSVSASQRVLRTRFRVRLRTDAATNSSVAKFQIASRNPYDGTLDFLEAFQVHDTTLITGTGAWRSRPPVDKGKRWGTEWTKTAVDAMQIHCRMLYAWYNHVNVRVTEIYWDVDVRDQPTITGTPAVTGATSTTFPSVSWVYGANADGDPQTAYRVKIFTSAQYGAAGFDPAVSSPVYDSGELAGAADSWTTPLGLLNGTTYKMYIAVAQDFNGAKWYSAWTASSSFTIALTPPPAPTLTVTQDNTVPNLRNNLTVAANANLLTADDASADATLGGWVNDTNTTLALSATQVNYGANALRMTAASAATMSIKTATGTGGYPVKAGVTYTFLASFRSAVTARTVKVGAAFYNRSGTIIGAVAYGTGAADTTSGWTQVSYQVAAPVGAVYATVFLQVTSPANAEIHYADTISMVTGASAAAWSPGGLVGSMSTVVERSWASAGKRNLVHPQIWTAGSHESTANGFFVSGAASAVAIDTANYRNGGSAIRWDVFDTTSKLYIGWPSAADENPSPTYAIAAVPGQSYTFAVYLKADAAFSATITLQAIDNHGNTVGSATTSGALAVTTAWQQFTLAFTPPAGAVWVRPQINNSASVTERQVWLDDVQWVVGATVDTNGAVGQGLPTVWEPVIGADLGDLMLTSNPGDQVRTVYDGAAPPGYTVLYRAWNNIPAAGATPALSSASTVYVPTVLTPPGPGIWVLRDPNLIYRSLQIHVTEFPSEVITEKTEVFQPLRPDDVEGGQRPVIVSDFMGGYDGQLTVVCDSEAEWLNLQDLLTVRGVLWLVFPDFGGRFVRLTARDGDRTSPRTGSGSDSVWRRTYKLQFLHTGRLG